jgi:hypothetical protein
LVTASRTSSLIVVCTVLDELLSLRGSLVPVDVTDAWLEITTPESTVDATVT